MALLSHKTKPVGGENLENWEFVGKGGFGSVYKARHKDWGFDVAVKILRDDVSLPEESALFAEAGHMEKVSCEYVLRVYGIYQGLIQGLPRQGIVMEFMGKGSVQSLLRDLGGPPPQPLVSRLAHQVALGMNFLHSRKLLHCDLKPSNVLLSDDLNAKLADFGLCRVSASASDGNRETELIGYTFKFKPPEAFDTSYEPRRAFDSYSYGILLWCIFTGKEPYPAAEYSLVALKVPIGDRPCLKDTDQKAELVDLMKKCWDGDPSNRPTFKECLGVTEKLFSMHRPGVPAAVYQVLTKLDPATSNQHQSINEVVGFSSQTPESHDSMDCRPMKTKSPSVQDPVPDEVSVYTITMSPEKKAKFVDDKRADLIQVISEVMAITEELGDMVHSETYALIKAKPTSMEKMRLLYSRTLRSGGIAVKAAFFDALKKHHPKTVEQLGG
ncbi:receptor-interacting serine/threonine-protein kinase 3-like [Xyrichtys novacula]|uniref:Receptor-interacting serine/threonine-protein kinase 3-like n=1 Tax=Xyrichtys novacula TaxID=13765 RepID=A0AAV1F7C3_XYRNO|nr:receptor-interacting serine/threonine-protein kinase 3-like [Xyrichtys novacula]